MLGKSISRFVIVPLDLEQGLGVASKHFSIKTRTRDWVKKRLELFKKYTMQSLLNQSNLDFKILLLCGTEHKSLTEHYPLHKKVKKVYDFGRVELERAGTDLVSITRVDSDDMLHQDAMKEVAWETGPNPIKMVWRKVYIYNELHNFISHRFIQCSPFATLVFKYQDLRDWQAFRNKFLSNPGYAQISRELMPFKVCTVRHDRNIHWAKLRRFKYDEPSKYQKTHPEYGNEIIDNDRKVKMILSNFGVRDGYNR